MLTTSCQAQFTTAISEAVATCDVMLALIGTRWTTAANATGGRRLDDPDDYVVAEIGAALERQVRVIPVLVDGARIPHAAELPERIQGLSRRNGFALDTVSWTRDLDALLATLGGHGPPSAEHNPADPRVDDNNESTTPRERPASRRRALATLPTRWVLLVIVIAAVTLGIALLAGGGSGGNAPVAGPAPQLTPEAAQSGSNIKVLGAPCPAPPKGQIPDGVYFGLHDPRAEAGKENPAKGAAILTPNESWASTLDIPEGTPPGQYIFFAACWATDPRRPDTGPMEFHRYLNAGFEVLAR